MNRILQEAGLSTRACRLTEVMTLNRLICPSSEHAMPDWIRRTALGDILQEDISQRDRKSTRLNSSHVSISYAVFCLKKKKQNKDQEYTRTKVVRRTVDCAQVRSV